MDVEVSMPDVRAVTDALFDPQPRAHAAIIGKSMCRNYQTRFRSAQTAPSEQTANTLIKAGQSGGMEEVGNSPATPAAMRDSADGSRATAGQSSGMRARFGDGQVVRWRIAAHQPALKLMERQCPVNPLPQVRMFDRSHPAKAFPPPPVFTPGI